MPDYISFVKLDGNFYLCSSSDNMTGAILLGLHNLMQAGRPDLSSKLEAQHAGTLGVEVKLYSALPKLEADRK